MKKVKMSIQVVVIFAVLFTSCGKKSCEEDKLADIPLSEKAANFVVYPEGDSLYYKNQNGTRLAFFHRVLESENRISIRVIGESYDPIYGEGECYEYFITNYKSDNLFARDEDLLGDNNGLYLLSTKVSNETKRIDSSEEQITFSFKNIWTGNITEGLYDLESNSFGEIYGNRMDKLGSIELNGKTFTSVLRARNEESGDMVYLKEGKGIIGFESEGAIFVLE